MAGGELVQQPSAEVQEESLRYELLAGVRSGIHRLGFQNYPVDDLATAIVVPEVSLTAAAQSEIFLSFTPGIIVVTIDNSQQVTHARIGFQAHRLHILLEEGRGGIPLGEASFDSFMTAVSPGYASIDQPAYVDPENDIGRGDMELGEVPNGDGVFLMVQHPQQRRRYRVTSLRVNPRWTDILQEGRIKEGTAGKAESLRDNAGEMSEAALRAEFLAGVQKGLENLGFDYGESDIASAISIPVVERDIFVGLRIGSFQPDIVVVNPDAQVTDVTVNTARLDEDITLTIEEGKVLYDDINIALVGVTREDNGIALLQAWGTNAGSRLRLTQGETHDQILLLAIRPGWREGQLGKYQYTAIAVPHGWRNLVEGRQLKGVERRKAEGEKAWLRGTVFTSDGDTVQSVATRWQDRSGGRQEQVYLYENQRLGKEALAQRMRQSPQEALAYLQERARELPQDPGMRKANIRLGHIDTRRQPMPIVVTEIDTHVLQYVVPVAKGDFKSLMKALYEGKEITLLEDTNHMQIEVRIEDEQLVVTLQETRWDDKTQTEQPVNEKTGRIVIPEKAFGAIASLLEAIK